MPVLYFSSGHALLQKEGLKKKKTIKRLHTIATQINIVNYRPNCWRYAFRQNI